MKKHDRRIIPYDENCNTLKKTDSDGQTSYTWDAENRLSSVTLPNGAGVVTFQYDPFGRRIQKSGPSGTTIFAYDGANAVEELNTGGAATAGYVQGPGIDEPLAQVATGLNYYQADGLGSVTSMTDSAGATSATFVYGAFGVLQSSTGSVANSYRYTAREFDQETNLYYYRARYLDSSTGRFISQDPIGYNGGINVYRYVRNNPVLFADPLGLCDVTRIKLWSTDEVTILRPRSPWELSVTHQENADGILPINNLWCHWTREYDTSVHTTTTYLVHEICDGVYHCEYHPKERFYFEKEQRWRRDTTTKTWDYGTFTLTGFDSDFLEEFYCKQHSPPSD